MDGIKGQMRIRSGELAKGKGIFLNDPYGGPGSFHLPTQGRFHHDDTPFRSGQLHRAVFRHSKEEQQSQKQETRHGRQGCGECRQP